MPVPNSFANVTTSIPLSQLDANFNTPITLGNTAIQLGNTVSTLNDMTLANVTVTSGNVTITNVTVTTANVTTANIATAQIANVTVSGTGTFAAGSNTAPSITFTGDTNTGIYSPSADTIAIATGGSKRFEVDAAGNAGLGVAPNTWSGTALQVGSGTAINGRTAVLSQFSSNQRWDGTNHKYLTTGTATIYTQNDGAHSWATAASGTAGNTVTFTQVMQVEGSKSLALEGATPQTGTGITFPAVLNASSNVNTLDDYEEGTWDPAVIGSTTAGTASYSVRVGRYTKIGNRVFFHFFISWSGGNGTGNLRVTGLPFTSDATANNFAVVNIYNSGVALLANTYTVGYVINNATTIGLDESPLGGGVVNTNVAYDAAGALLISGHYMT